MVVVSLEEYTKLILDNERFKTDYDRLIGGLLGQAEVIGEKGKEFLYWAGSTRLRNLLKDIEPEKYEMTLARLIKEKEKEYEKSTELPL